MKNVPIDLPQVTNILPTRWDYVRRYAIVLQVVLPVLLEKCPDIWLVGDCSQKTSQLAFKQFAFSSFFFKGKKPTRFSIDHAREGRPDQGIELGLTVFFAGFRAGFYEICICPSTCMFCWIFWWNKVFESWSHFHSFRYFLLQACR